MNDEINNKQLISLFIIIYYLIYLLKISPVRFVSPCFQKSSGPRRTGKKFGILVMGGRVFGKKFILILKMCLRTPIPRENYPQHESR